MLGYKKRKKIPKKDVKVHRDVDSVAAPALLKCG